MKRNSAVKKPDLVLEVDSYISFSDKAIHSPSVLKKLDRQSELALARVRRARKLSEGNRKKKTK